MYWNANPLSNIMERNGSHCSMRCFVIQEANQMELQNEYSVGIYCRLSRDDNNGC